MAVEHIRLAGRLPAQDKLVKIKDEGDRVIVLQWTSNSRGRFIEVSVTPRNGRGRHIIILEDNNSRGWENMARVLHSDFMEEDRPKNRKPFVHHPLEFPGIDGRKPKGKPPEVWKRKASQGEWTLCICVERIDANLPWGKIEDLVSLAPMRKTKVHVIPFAKDRGIICGNSWSESRGWMPMEPA